MKGIHRHTHRHSPLTRDAALRRLSASKRWLIAGSVALTGVFTEVAAQAFPGKKLSSGGAAASHHASRPSSRPAETPESFHPPEQPPQAAGEGSGESRAPEGDGGAGSESAPQSSESQPPSSESSPPTEAPAQAAPEAPAREEAPTVSGGS